MARLGDRSQVILEHIGEHGEITTAEAAQKLGITSDAASAYLGRLASSGRIAKLGRGVYASLVPTVGSVGSVGIPNDPNEHNRGYESANLLEAFRNAKF
jgi:DeoR/GlpR family transcriptional regulator of sugar metabolism